MSGEFVVFFGAWLSLECASVFLSCMVYLVGCGSDDRGYVIVFVTVMPQITYDAVQ